MKGEEDNRKSKRQSRLDARKSLMFWKKRRSRTRTPQDETSPAPEATSRSAIGTAGLSEVEQGLEIMQTEEMEISKNISENFEYQSCILFNIPREVRDLIYMHLYDICLSPKTAPALYAKDPATTSIRLDRWRGARMGSLIYARPNPRYSLLPILQVSRQVRSEFSQLLAREMQLSASGKLSRGRGLRYEMELDVSTKRRDVPVLWKVLPLPPTLKFSRIEELKMNYRLSITSEHELRDTSFNFVPNGMEPGPACHPFLRFFSDFFNHGPHGFFDAERFPAAGFHIGKLVISMRFQCAENLRRILIVKKYDTSAEKQEKEEFRRRLGIYTKNISDGLRDFLLMMIRKGYFYERVGEIELDQKGDRVQRWTVPDSGWTYWGPDPEWEELGLRWGKKERASRSSTLCHCSATGILQELKRPDLIAKEAHLH